MVYLNETAKNATEHDEFIVRYAPLLQKQCNPCNVCLLLLKNGIHHEWKMVARQQAREEVKRKTINIYIYIVYCICSINEAKRTTILRTLRPRVKYRERIKLNAIVDKYLKYTYNFKVWKYCLFQHIQVLSNLVLSYLLKIPSLFISIHSKFDFIHKLKVNELLFYRLNIF